MGALCRCESVVSSRTDKPSTWYSFHEYCVLGAYPMRGVTPAFHLGGLLGHRHNTVARLKVVSDYCLEY